MGQLLNHSLSFSLGLVIEVRTALKYMAGYVMYILMRVVRRDFQFLGFDFGQL